MYFHIVAYLRRFWETFYISPQTLDQINWIGYEERQLQRWRLQQVTQRRKQRHRSGEIKVLASLLVWGWWRGWGQGCTLWLMVFSKASRRKGKPKVTRRNTRQEYPRISWDRDSKLAPKYLFWSTIEQLNVPMRNKSVEINLKFLEWGEDIPTLEESVFFSESSLVLISNRLDRYNCSTWLKKRYTIR